MRIIWAIVAIVIFLIVAAFALLNMQSVVLEYYLGIIKLPLAVVVIAAFIIGALIGLLIGYVRGKRRSSWFFQVLLESADIWLEYVRKSAFYGVL